MSANATLWLIIAGLLATLNNGVIEYLLGTPFDRIERLKPWKWMLMYASVATALLIVVGLRMNFVLALLVLAWPDISAGTTLGWWVTAVLSAVAIARGSNYIANLPWLRDQTPAALPLLEGVAEEREAPALE